MSERVYPTRTDRATAKKQRQRARRRAEFVAANPGRLDVVNRNLVSAGKCPIGCACFDCLFPATEYRPRVARFVGARA